MVRNAPKIVIHVTADGAWELVILPKELPDVVIDRYSTYSYSEAYFLYEYRQFYIEDKKVYYYPHIEITRASGKVETKYFDDESDMDKWIESNISDVNLIEI